MGDWCYGPSSSLYLLCISTQVHNEDVAGIILHAIENENVTGVLNAVSPQTATNADFSKSLAAAMWRPAFFPLPGCVKANRM